MRGSPRVHLISHWVLNSKVYAFLSFQWTQIGGKLKWISSGRNIVWGVNSANNIYFRQGISKETPEGTNWVHVGGRLSQIDTNEFSMWGVNLNYDAYSSSFTEPASKFLFTKWIYNSKPLQFKEDVSNCVLSVPNYYYY